MESVANFPVALYLTSAVSDPDKGTWVFQQAHNLCFWQLSVTLVVCTSRPIVSGLTNSHHIYSMSGRQQLSPQLVEHLMLCSAETVQQASLSMARTYLKSRLVWLDVASC